MSEKNHKEKRRRLRQLAKLQVIYADFRDFYGACSEELLGFIPTDMQNDMAEFLQDGPRYRMIQAQRGEAKTTETGCYGVWRLIHDPSEIVLIISAGGPMAEQVASWMIQIIGGMPELACLVPDKNNPTTKTSLKAYDVHHLLKGVNKSPSIACLGVTSNMQGYRATVLIADDIESGKNAATPLMREQLLQKTRDFTSINRKNDIIYLGTPQTNASIYASLPARGYEIRIWPGRVPNPEEVKNYGGMLAPFIMDMIDNGAATTGFGMAGDRGEVTDPGMMSEDDSVAKEIDQGPAYYNLQYMLDTKLADSHRFPLKLSDMIFFPLDAEEAPAKFIWGPSPTVALIVDHGLSTPVDLYGPANAIIGETYKYTHRVLALDPAGEGTANRDETGYCVLFISNGKFFCMDVGGIQGASTAAGKKKIVDLIKKWGINQIIAEKNFGGGMFTAMLTGLITENELLCKVDEVWNTGQKEVRIIDALQPVFASHRIIFNTSIIENDFDAVQQYSGADFIHYMFLYQIANISRLKNALIHDDKLEALAIGVRFLYEAIKINEEKANYEEEQGNWQEFLKNPNNKSLVPSYSTDPQVKSFMSTRVGMNQCLGNAMSKYRR